jgi:YfiH family protein
VTVPRGAPNAAPGAVRETVTAFAAIGVTAFTTTRHAGDFGLAGDVPPSNPDRWLSLAASLLPATAGMVSAVQVHGAAIAEHTAPWTGLRRLEGFDAHVLRTPGAAVVTIADCVPVFVAHPSGDVAVVHAGWRGVAGNILPAVIERLVGAWRDRADVLVHLGPAICGRCYEVGPDVYERLTGWQTIRHRHVDLRALLSEQAKEAGITHVTASPSCTRCDNDNFFSHRAGDAARQVAVVVSAHA